MSVALEELSPSYLGEQRIEVALADASATCHAHKPILLRVSVSRCVPEGVVYPLELIVSGPSRHSFKRRVLYRPIETFVFTPIEGGPHLITVREFAHNRWWGCVHLNITGTLLEKQKAF